CLQYNRFPYSF
nr:immunoglobulin light chain junction region [Macaca mulatta]MOV34183.1 immunoglobulin light chain junction region [Macaca mulatta]MOV34316.1 immunoglobulin light chain junction region [Macaca mulatta]MOV34915.1 immunoglobulin light chain junction region [Macaca mulatta]MOV35389.1 immunoglobulin light chain junction region [Macaca mulatta]